MLLSFGVMCYVVIVIRIVDNFCKEFVCEGEKKKGVVINGG